MSVQWSATLGYGFKMDLKGTLNALPEYNERLDDIEYLVEKEYPLLDLGYAGSMFTSDGYEQWIFIKDSMVHARDWSMQLDMDKITNSLSEEAIQELFRFVADTGTTVGGLEWRLMISAG